MPPLRALRRLRPMVAARAAIVVDTVQSCESLSRYETPRPLTFA
jgi:hypothetical protein